MAKKKAAPRAVPKFRRYSIAVVKVVDEVRLGPHRFTLHALSARLEQLERISVDSLQHLRPEAQEDAATLTDELDVFHVVDYRLQLTPYGQELKGTLDSRIIKLLRAETLYRRRYIKQQERKLRKHLDSFPAFVKKQSK